MVQRHATRLVRVQQLLRVLPYLRGVCTEREPKANKVGLERMDRELMWHDVLMDLRREGRQHRGT